MVLLAVNGERALVPDGIPPSTRLIEFLRTSTRFRVSYARVLPMLTQQQLWW
jgi:hypothetical protein